MERTIETSAVVKESQVYYCEHIDAKKGNVELVKQFTVKNPTVTEPLRLNLVDGSVFVDEYAHRVRTYLVRRKETDEIVGYFSLKAGMVSIDEKIVHDDQGQQTVFDTLPGIELAYFAINQEYITQHPDETGCGVTIFRKMILPIVKDISKLIGVKLLYLFAFNEPTLLERYEKKYHFHRLSPTDEHKLHNRLKPHGNDGCIYMFQKV